MKKIGYCIMVIVMLCGCEELQTKAVTDNALPLKEESYDIYSLCYSKNRAKTDLEIADKCLKGAYILGDRNTEYDIKSFEDMTGEHDIYVYHMEAEEDFPLSFVINCVAKDKIPYIVISQSGEAKNFDYSALSNMAKDFGRFDVPMLVGFYPKSVAKQYDSKEYIEYFRTARDMFNKYAKKVDFVWSIYSENVLFAQEYYPGDDFVDWVGLEVYEDIDENGIIKAESDIELFVDKFQDKKPILLNVAVAHYSTLDYKYYVNEAVAEIERLYSMPKKYSAIKAINYMDFNQSALYGGGGVKFNYLLTDNDDILSAYREAVAEDIMQNAMLRYKNIAYVKNGSVYVGESVIDYFNLKDEGIRIDINGIRCVEINQLAKVVIDSQTKTAVVL